MRSLALLSAVMFMSASFQDAMGEKPRMFPDNDTIFLQEGNEMRIECYSKEAQVQFSFPEAEVMIPRSDYKIFQTGNGTYTFLRSSVIPDDAGWYACAEEGIEIDNHFSNINHTHKDISWIYVYVEYHRVWFFPEFGFRIQPKTIIAVAGSTLVVPCRSTSPPPRIELFQNFELLPTDGTAVQYDPKIGFIIKAVDFKDSEAVLQCTMQFDEDDYVLRFSGQRPTMITAGSELTIQEGTELRIECYSKTKLTFLFPEGFSNSSKYEIFANESGVNTFLRRSAVADDTGWYGCAGEGIRNDIPYYSINYTMKEISWIYVYVNSTVPITSGLMFYVDYYAFFAIIPCRPTSPGLNVQLVTWRNGSFSEPAMNFPFNPKLGFVIRRPYTSKGVFACTTNEPVGYVSKTYNLTFVREEARKYGKPAIVDVDDPLATEASSFRMTGDDLRLHCELVAPEVAFFRLEWRIPTAVSNDRVQYHETRADGVVNNSRHLQGKKSMITITNISETDSGEYICIVKKSKSIVYSPEFTAEDSRHVEVFEFHLMIDKNGVRYMKLSKQGGKMLVTGLTGGTIRWLLDLEDFPSANISWCISPVTNWFDKEGQLINDPSNPDRRRHVHSTSRKGSPHLLFAISGLNSKDIGSYQLSIHTGDITTLVEFTLIVRVPPLASMQQLYRRMLPTEEHIAVLCSSYGSPRPDVTFSFLNLPKFPSHTDAKLTDPNEIGGAPYQFFDSTVDAELHYLKFIINMSGVLTCEACNSINCSQDKIQFLFAASDKPYFTSTNLNHSNVTLSLGIFKNITFILECYAAGRPYPNVTWFKDNRLLQEDIQFKSAYDNRELTFKNGALNRLNPELPIVDQAELLPYDMKWEFPRELLTFDKILGSGAFGIVKKVAAKSVCRGEAVTTVAVKLVRSKASLNFITALTRELKILVYLGKHINVVNLLGACTKHVSYGELFVIVEYCRFGNLHDYLVRGRADFVDQTRSNTGETPTLSVGADQINTTDETPNSNDGYSTEARGQDTGSTSTSLEDENRTSGEDSRDAQGLRSNYRGDCEDMNLEPVCTRDLVYWSWQVSRGMDYLGKRKVVHGDLAARNILLAENGIVKISDFGLSKALYEEAQYRDKGMDPLPVKWMAIESIRDRIFSYQSDIWSFGIVMWEFFTLAKTPYPGIKCRELYQQLINGYRMEKPEFATSTLYGTMLDCWKSDPSERPSFIKLAHSLGDSLDEGFKSRYLEINSLYLEIDARIFENEKKDYLTLSPSTFDAPASATVHEQIEMDGLAHDESANSV